MAGRALNSYLADPNEYRAILRSLLHCLGGEVDYTTNTITITLDRPERPRVARALRLLTEELNATLSNYAHRPSATDLPARPGISFNNHLVPT
jgi:hypothetical protein